MSDRSTSQPANVVAQQLAEWYIKWEDSKLRNSTDEVFRAGLNFVKMARMHRSFKESIRYGDAIHLEYLYSTFTPAWLALGKNIYFEIALSTVEQFYGRVPFPLLQVIRDNRAVPIYDRTDKDGTPMANWSQDGIIEDFQVRYKAMSFINTPEEWEKNSVNMPLVSQCRTQVDNEYTKRSDVESFNEKWVGGVANGPKTDIGNKKRASKVPRQEQEKALVHEVLTLSKFFVETPGRKFNTNHVWSVLPKVTTKLSKPEPKTSTSGFDEDAILEEIAEQALDSDPIGTGATGEGDDSNVVEALMTHVEGSSEDVVNGDSPSVRVTNETVTVAGKTKKVKKHGLHPFIMKDVFAIGKEKMCAKDIVAIRHRAKHREARERKALMDDLFIFLKGNMGGGCHKLFQELEEALDAESESPKSPMPSRKLAKMLRDMK